MKTVEAFLHPRRTAALVDSLAGENAALRAAAEETERAAAEAAEALAAARREAEGLRGSLREQEQSQQELMRLLFSVRSGFEDRVRELEARLRDSEIDTGELEEIDRQVRRMTESQEAYRRRIADLKMQLAEARAEAARLSGLKSSGLRPLIRMDTEGVSSSAADTLPAPEEQAGSVSPGESEAASSADGMPQDPADTDWLLPLPPTV